MTAGSGASMTIQLNGLDAVEAALSPGGVALEIGPVIETAVIDAGKAFLADVKLTGPRRGNRRPSQWERQTGAPVGQFVDTIRQTNHRKGADTTTLIKIGSGFGNMVRSGTKPHDIFPGAKGPGHDIRLLGRQIRVVHHPGAKPNRWWDEAELRIDGTLGELSRAAGTASADRIQARMKAKGL
jgi:hypothetical protein